MLCTGAQIETGALLYGADAAAQVLLLGFFLFAAFGLFLQRGHRLAPLFLVALLRLESLLFLREMCK